MSQNTLARVKSCLQDGHLTDARELCKSYCMKNENDSEAWFILGTIHGNCKEYTEAKNCLLRSLSLRPDIAATHYNLGLVYLHASEHELACESFNKALRLNPDSVATRLELANALNAGGNPEKAIKIYEAILESDPSSLPVLNNLAAAYIATKEPEKAIHLYKKIIELYGESAEKLFILGNTLRLTGRLQEAETAYRNALNFNPRLSGVLNNLGLTLYDQGQFTEAEIFFHQSLDSEPIQYDAYINLANCLQEQRKPSDAKAVLEKAIELFPDKTEIHWDLGLVLLKLGQFEEGWKQYEWRLKGGGVIVRSIPLSLWQGEDISSKTILITAEQGIGDEIMFASCFRDMTRLAAKVVIECDKRLAPLFRRSFTDCRIYPGNQSDDTSLRKFASDADVYISAGSLPLYLRKHLADFPEHTGYLTANPDLAEEWRSRYKSLGSNLNVGISWKGGHVSKAKKRSSMIYEWLPLLNMPDINLINLQYGDIQSDICVARVLSDNTIHHWNDSDPLMDMDFFAAQISALDLVISVDNSTVHLAGALGVKTWVLQPFSPDWRWLDNSSNSHWYPSVSQFHPSAHGKWDSVISSVANHLMKLVASQ